MGAERLMGSYILVGANSRASLPKGFEPLPNLLTGRHQVFNEVSEKTGVARREDVGTAEDGEVVFDGGSNAFSANGKACGCGNVVGDTYMESVSLVEKLNEIRSMLGKEMRGSGCHREEGYQQLEFSFSYTSSEEIFFKFVRSTAEQGGKLSFTQSETFLQIRQRIALQFKIGGSIETESLIGFQKASERLSKFGDVFDKLLHVSGALLKGANYQDLNEFLRQLGGVFENVGDDGKFKEFIDRFLNQWMEKLFPQFGKNEGGFRNFSMNSEESRISLSFQMEFRFEMSVDIQMAVQKLEQQQDPIVLDLEGDGIELTTVEDGVRFDIRGTGKPVQTGWIKGGDAFLARDIDGNGRIDSGLELFGDQWGSRNGFEELRKLDSNGDGFIGQEDREYHQLVVWRDNGDGVSTPDEMLTLQEAGIERIALNYKDTNIITETNNVISQKSFFIRKDKSVGRVVDVLLNYRI